MSLLASIVAVDWEWELRGTLIVIIATTVFIGSIYAILSTNLGARLGFLVALCGLAGWLALMGIVWLMYGIGMRGPEPSWQGVAGREVLQDTTALFQAGILEDSRELTNAGVFDEGTEVTPEAEALLVANQFGAEDWVPLDLSSPTAAQAAASAGELLEETGAFDAGEYQATRVFDVGGERYPMIGEFDLLAFFHKPHYVVVEVAPVEQVRTEPGRAAPATQIDESGQRQYVYMIRDLGARRQPAFMLTIGGTIIFLALCWILHRRDQRVAENLAEPAPAPPVPATTAGS